MSINRRRLFEAAAAGAALGGFVTPVQAKDVAPGRRANLAELERNKQVVRDYFERCFNRGDLDFGKTIISPDLTNHMLYRPPTRIGYDGWRRGVSAFAKVFPDQHWDIKQITAEGDIVAVRTVWTGTHSAEYMGVPASGRKIKAANADFYRLEDGKYVEHWDIPDWLSIVRQIGGTLDGAAMFGGSTDP